MEKNREWRTRGSYAEKEIPSPSHIPPNFWPCSLDHDLDAVKLIIIHSTGEADLSQIVPPWALLTELSHFQETGPSSEGASVAQLCRPVGKTNNCLTQDNIEVKIAKRTARVYHGSTLSLFEL